MFLRLLMISAFLIDSPIMDLVAVFPNADAAFVSDTFAINFTPRIVLFWF